jgi:hypothetical protein
MEITKEFLHQKEACEQSYKWVCENKLIGLEHEEFIDKLMKNNRFSEANWLLTKLFDETQCVKYAVFCAQQVIDIFEKKYPDDKRPRKAIEAAKDYLESPNDVTYAAAVAAAANAADAAEASVYAAANAAYAAHYAAYDANAAYAAEAYAAANAAYAAYYAAYYANAAYAAEAYAAEASVYAGIEEMRMKILNFGMGLLREKNSK